MKLDHKMSYDTSNIHDFLKSRKPRILPYFRDHVNEYAKIAWILIDLISYQFSIVEFMLNMLNGLVFMNTAMTFNNIAFNMHFICYLRFFAIMIKLR